MRQGRECYFGFGFNEAEEMVIVPGSVSDWLLFPMVILLALVAPMVRLLAVKGINIRYRSSHNL